VYISASWNGVKSTSAIMHLDDTWDTQTLAFHGGVYNQIDYTDTTDPEDGSVYIISDLSFPSPTPDTTCIPSSSWPGRFSRRQRWSRMAWNPQSNETGHSFRRECSPDRGV
jgi:hypothetical protein